jgi:hypothetical protein
MIKYILFTIILFQFSFGQEYPKNWPWRGVNIPVDILKYENNIFDELDKKSINSIRIHVDFIKYIKENKSTHDESINEVIILIDTLLNEIRKYNMTAIIGIENFPYSKIECKDKFKKEYWSSNYCLNDMYNLAEILSVFFSKRGDELTGYQFMSEAIFIDNNESKLPDRWDEIQQNILTIIRKNDKKHFFVYSPTLWALSDTYDKVNLLDDQKVIYNAHYFYPYNYTHQGIKENKFNIKYPSFINFQYWNKSKLEGKMSNLLEFREDYNVPILIGSFSKMNWINDSNIWLEDILDIFEINSVSWLYFIIGSQPWEGWDPRYIGNYKSSTFIKEENNDTLKILEKYFKKNKEK